MKFWQSIALALCILAAAPSLSRAQEQLARGGGGEDPDPASRDAKTSTPTPAPVSGSNVLSQLDDAKRHADALKAETAALKKEVAADVAEVRRLKGDPGAQDAAYNRLFDAIRGGQSDIEANLQAIIQIGRSLLATAGR
jgi:hypothetical protein